MNGRMRGSRRHGGRMGLGGIWLAAIVVAYVVAGVLALAEVLVTLLVRLPLAVLTRKRAPPRAAPKKRPKWPVTDDDLQAASDWYDKHVAGGARLNAPRRTRRTA